MRAPWLLWLRADRALNVADGFKRRRLIGILSAAAVVVALVARQNGILNNTGFSIAVILALLADVLICCPSFHRPFAFAIISLSLVDVSPFQLSDSFVRIYQLGSLLLPVCLFGTVIRGTHRRGLLLSLTAFTVLVWVSLSTTVSWSDTLHVAVGQAYLLGLAWIVVVLHRRGVLTLERSLQALLVGCTLGSLAALGEYLLTYVGVDLHVFQQSGIPWARPGGLMREPDWAGLVAALGLFLVSYSRLVRRPWLGIGIGTLHLTVLGLTAVRSVLLAVLATVLVLLLLPRVPRRTRIVSGASLVSLAIAIAALFTLSPTISARLDPQKVQQGTVDGGAANSRVAVLRLVLEEAPNRPWTGHGAGSIAYATSQPGKAQTYGGGGELNGGHGSANILASTFYDLGVPGLVAIGGVVLLWLWRAWRAAEPALLPLALLCLVTFNLTNGFRFGFVWVLMALTCVAPVRKATVSRPLAP